MRTRVLGAGVVVVAIALLVIVWPTNTDRTDEILDVYAEQLGITKEEAREDQEYALTVADFVCSIEPANLIEALRSTGTSVEYAIKFAEAACPATARQFEAAVARSEASEPLDETVRADLTVTLEPGLSTPEIRDLGFAISFLSGVEDVQGNTEELVVELKPGASQSEVESAILAMAGVAAVERA